MSSNPAAELQRLLDEAPYVRALARSLASGDADEIVQQTWLHAVEHGGGSVEQPRSWLGRVVRNVAYNLARGERRRRGRERAPTSAAFVPSSAELVEREERRRELVCAVDRLPVELREVVLLRYFEGLPPRRIAAELGVAVETIWNRHSRALRMLRRQLAAEGVDRRAWLAPLLGTPFPRGPAPLWPSATLIPGAVAMLTKTKIAAVAVVMLALLTYASWPGGGAPAPGRIAEGNTAQSRVAQVDVPRDAGAADSMRQGAERQRVDAPVVVSPRFGSLVVTAVYGGDRAPAAGITMNLARFGADPRVGVVRRRTDAEGIARFDELPPGEVQVWGDRADPGRRAAIEAGAVVELEIELPVGMTVTGLVVDADGAPVADALVEVAMMALVGRDPEVLATTDHDGRFEVRGAPAPCLVGARAAGYAASQMLFLFGDDGDTEEVRLVLRGAGGTVDGLVVGPDGRPAAGAVVCIGVGDVQGLHGRDGGARLLPALARSDAEGRFRAVGIPPGEHPVWARAEEFAPWSGSCVVLALVSTGLRIDLGAGGRLRGIVRSTDGTPIPGADVEIGDWMDVAHFQTRSTDDGSFELQGLLGGELTVTAAHDDFGKAARVVRIDVEAPAECALVLSRGLELVGRVLDETGAPVANLGLEFTADATSDAAHWYGFAITDTDGRFAVANCPQGRLLRGHSAGRTSEPVTLDGLDPRTGPVELRVRRTAAATARIVGTVVGADGRPVADAKVFAQRTDVETHGSGLLETDDAGRFEIGPLAAGRWRVVVRAEGYPTLRTDATDIVAAATRNLGVLRLTAGGTAVIRVVGDLRPRLMIADTASPRRWALPGDREPLTTPALEPGEYRLLAWGGGAAAHSRPISIRAGEQTEIEVRPESGIRQRFELSVADGSAVGSGATLWVRQGGERLVEQFVEVRAGEPWTAEIWFAPGSYELTATSSRLRGELTLVIGAIEAGAIRLELR